MTLWNSSSGVFHLLGFFFLLLLHKACVCVSKTEHLKCLPKTLWEYEVFRQPKNCSNYSLQIWLTEYLGNFFLCQKAFMNQSSILSMSLFTINICQQPIWSIGSLQLFANTPLKEYLEITLLVTTWLWGSHQSCRVMISVQNCLKLYRLYKAVARSQWWRKKSISFPDSILSYLCYCEYAPICKMTQFCRCLNWYSLPNTNHVLSPRAEVTSSLSDRNLT